MEKKFGVPFSGAADELTSAGDDAAKAAPFSSEQVDESRKGAMRGVAKYSMDVDCKMMQSTPPSSDGYTVMKKMEIF